MVAMRLMQCPLGARINRHAGVTLRAIAGRCFVANAD